METPSKNNVEKPEKSGRKRVNNKLYRKLPESQSIREPVVQFLAVKSHLQSEKSNSREI